MCLYRFIIITTSCRGLTNLPIFTRVSSFMRIALIKCKIETCIDLSVSYSTARFIFLALGSHVWEPTFFLSGHETRVAFPLRVFMNKNSPYEIYPNTIILSKPVKSSAFLIKSSAILQSLENSNLIICLIKF